MIDIVCDLNPLIVGKTRKVQVSGDGPFTVKVANFVTDPEPSGLHEQFDHTVQQDESFEVSADEEFWKSRKGCLQIDITDAKGRRRRLHFNIQPAPRGLSCGVARA